MSAQYSFPSPIRSWHLIDMLIIPSPPPLVHVWEGGRPWDQNELRRGTSFHAWEEGEKGGPARALLPRTKPGVFRPTMQPHCATMFIDPPTPPSGPEAENHRGIPCAPAAFCFPSSPSPPQRDPAASPGPPISSSTFSLLPTLNAICA